MYRNTHYRQWRDTGFTIIELMIVIAIVGLLTMVALPAYQDYSDRVDNGTAANDLRAISLAITDFKLNNGSNPTSLASIKMDGMQDPWGNAYEYVNHETATNGDKRKKNNIVPVNSDFDVYSRGKDGVTAISFSSDFAKDDIVRCNNGNYYGLAKDY